MLVNLMVKIIRFARASLRFDQKMEDIIVKSDVNIKKENLEPENNYDQDRFNTDTVKQEPGNDTDLDFNNDNQYWYEPETSFVSSEHPNGEEEMYDENWAISNLGLETCIFFSCVALSFFSP